MAQIVLIGTIATTGFAQETWKKSRRERGGNKRRKVYREVSFNNRIIREPTERMEQGKLGLLDVPVFVDRADDVANNRTQPASILLLRTHRTCPLLRLILR